MDECQAAMSDGRTRQGCGTGTSQLQQLLQVDSEIARYSRHEGKDFASIQASQEQSVRHKFEKYTSMEACDTRQTAIKLTPTIIRHKSTITISILMAIFRINLS